MPSITDARIPFDRPATDAGRSNTAGKLTRLFSWLYSMFRRLICMVTGHKMVLHFEPRRLALRCLDCGYQTPGWTVGELTVTRLVAPMPPQKLASDRAA
jgi:hypothetical protein